MMKLCTLDYIINVQLISSMNCIVNIEKHTICFSVSVRKRKPSYINTFIIIKQHIQFSRLTDKEAAYVRLITSRQSPLEITYFHNKLFIKISFMI